MTDNNINNLKFQQQQAFENFEARLKSGDALTALKAEFQALQLEEQKLWRDTKSFVTGPKLAQLNRYSDIFPYEPTIFPAECKTDPRVYFNANLLGAASNPRFANFPVNFVAHQAPLPENYAAFWRAVYATKAIGIVMITGVIENGRRKADPYWPQKEGEEIKFENFGISVKNCGEFDKEISNSKGMSKTLISISEMNQQQQPDFKTILFRYNDWPDHGVPRDAVSYRHLIEKVQERIQSSLPSSSSSIPNLFVHCSAGIGRTGTLIGTLIGDHMFKNGVFDAARTPFEVVRWLKHQRVGSVQQSEQYLFLHTVLQQQMKDFLAK
jgi:protein tyrosine phosphatase